jgi:hypothetical protein
MEIIDNRLKYRAREKALRFEQPMPRFITSTLEHSQRVVDGLKFQHTLRVEREVKRRIGASKNERD